MKYDYLIVGAGLFGAVFAHKAKQAGYNCLVIDRRLHIGGNIYCEQVEGINVHKYGAHIFHTSNKVVWDFVNSFVEFNRYTNSPIANYRGQLFNLPFNMNTFYQLWGVHTPQEAMAKLEEQKAEAKALLGDHSPRNLEEQAKLLVGKDIYEILIKGYTEKQWGRKCTELPSFIIRRLPLRMTFDNNYFNDIYQGIPIGGYNKLINSLLEGIEVKLNVDYITHRGEFEGMANCVLYTGALDEYFDYSEGCLQYRTISFKTTVEDTPNYQGNAVINYTDSSVPYTRIIEHKHFERFGSEVYDSNLTVISKEYSREWKFGLEPYYPINDKANTILYAKYYDKAKHIPNFKFGGRLADYAYYDMDKVIERALEMEL